MLNFLCRTRENFPSQSSHKDDPLFGTAGKRRPNFDLHKSVYRNIQYPQGVAICVGLQVTYSTAKERAHGLDGKIPESTGCYMGQVDVHIGKLTVEETVQFACNCVMVG